MLRDNNSAIYLPSEIQKDYPNKNSPPAATLELAGDVGRLLSSYFKNRWKDSGALFPSRSSCRCTMQAVRDMLHKMAAEAQDQTVQD